MLAICCHEPNRLYIMTHSKGHFIFVVYVVSVYFIAWFFIASPVHAAMTAGQMNVLIENLKWLIGTWHSILIAIVGFAGGLLWKRSAKIEKDFREADNIIDLRLTNSISEKDRSLRDDLRSLDEALHSAQNLIANLTLASEKRSVESGNGKHENEIKILQLAERVRALEATIEKGKS